MNTVVASALSPVNISNTSEHRSSVVRMDPKLLKLDCLMCIEISKPVMPSSVPYRDNSFRNQGNRECILTDAEIEPCAICLADDAGLAYIKLPSCSHQFHPQCIATWMSNPQRWMNESPTCPVCREPIEAENNKSLKHYNEVLSEYKALVKGNQDSLPVIKKFESKLNNREMDSVYRQWQGYVSEDFWDDTHLEDFINHVKASKRCLNRISFKVSTVEKNYLKQANYPREKVEKLFSCIEELNQQLTELKDLYDGVTPPYRFFKQTGDVPNRDFLLRQVKVDNLIQFSQKIENKLAELQLQIPRMLEFLFGVEGS